MDEAGDDVICLANQVPLASGSFRSCYVHPLEADKCIKVTHEGAERHRRGIVDRLLGLRDRHPNLREWKEYCRLKKRGVPLERYFPKIHGLIKTDKGPGLVVDLLRGSDRQLPVSVLDYTRGHRPDGLDPDTVLTEYAVFAGFCVQHRIFASCDEPGNVGFLRTPEGYRFISYDLKQRRNKELIPIATLLPAERRRKVARRFSATLRWVAEQLKIDWRRSGTTFLRCLIVALICMSTFASELMA